MSEKSPAVRAGQQLNRNGGLMRFAGETVPFPTGVSSGHRKARAPARDAVCAGI